MGIGKRITAAAVGAASLAATGAVVELKRRRRQINRRAGESISFGTLHSPGRLVIASDGVPLHVEVDEDRDADAPDVTLVFMHGYALSLDCWHFQRAAFAGKVRALYYDHRSHGRSGRGDRDNASIDQLGDDLSRVIAQQPGRVILIGHSMGGMTIAALAERHPELFGPKKKVVGCMLISTTAGGLDPARLLFPLIPKRFAGPLAKGTLLTLTRAHHFVEGGRRMSRAAAVVATDALAFGGPVPSSYVEFVDDMLAETPVAVVAEFFPGFGDLDKFDSIDVLGKVPTTIVSGTKDRITYVGHSRKLHSRIPGSTLLEFENAGHMVILERHEEITMAIEDLIAQVE